MSVSIKQHGMVIDGTPTIILCGSLFYFRINKEDWSDRMRQLKHAGYNAIDVYFPWTFHEPEEGLFLFEGQRDIRTFLELAHTHGLYVVARPGPYICSEYDLGGLPSYLLAKEDIVLRDNNPHYLFHVKRYFDQILPILSEYQHGKNGSIIALQIENELDFYHKVCTDQYGYIKALYQMSEPYDFDIPIIACAGQGDELGATGGFEDVVPTFNFYPFSNSLKFESIAFHKYQELQQRSLPLFVTETNRSAGQLRRLLASGVSLLGPYNQVGGTDFGFTNAINNWGDPLTYLTSDYDFGGLISPKGETKRGWKEAILFGKFLQTHGHQLAEAVVTPDVISYEGETLYQLPCTMTLKNGATIYTLSNFKTETPVSFTYQGEVYPKEATLTLQPHRNRFFVHQYPVQEYQLDVMIDYALCEINQIIRDRNTLYLICVFEGETEVSIDGVRYLLTDHPIFIPAEHQTLVLYPLSMDKACRLETIRDGLLLYSDSRETLTESLGTIDMMYQHVDVKIPRKTIPSGSSTWLEDHQIFRGYGEYHYEDVTGDGIYVEQASDIITPYINGKGLKSIIAANTPLVIEQPLKADTISFKTEIWGHTNFHDSRLPGLELSAKRGLHNVFSMSNKRPFTNGMIVSHHSILVPTGNEYRTIRINGKEYRFDRFYPVIALGGLQHQELFVSDEVLAGDVFDITPLEPTKLTAFGEQELRQMTTADLNRITTSFPQPVSKGEMIYLSIDISNPQQENMYLKFTATECQCTVLFKEEIVGRLLFHHQDRMRMTGGSPDTVYLPGKWFTQTVGTIHILLEGLDNGTLQSVEQYIVHGTQWIENIKTMKEEIQK